MSNDVPAPEEPVSYALRVRERARRDINSAYVRFAEIVSEPVANAWRDGLMDAIAGLATMPRRCPLASERFRHEVRQLLYQRPGSQAVYRILFTIINEQPQLLDPPTVVILHVRHGSVRPVTRTQIREIEAEE